MRKLNNKKIIKKELSKVKGKTNEEIKNSLHSSLIIFSLSTYKLKFTKFFKLEQFYKQNKKEINTVNDLNDKLFDNYCFYQENLELWILYKYCCRFDGTGNDKILLATSIMKNKNLVFTQTTSIEIIKKVVNTFIKKHTEDIKEQRILEKIERYLELFVYAKNVNDLFKDAKREQLRIFYSDKTLKTIKCTCTKITKKTINLLQKIIGTNELTNEQIERRLIAIYEEIQLKLFERNDLKLGF